MRPLLPWVSFALAASAIACGPVPIPDEFDAAFVKGSVCMPSDAHTGTLASETPAKFPLRFDFCLYRCVAIAPGTPFVRYFWSCAGELCQMTVLATSHMLKVSGEDDCDGADLESPPKSECTDQTVSFMVDPPCCEQDATTSDQTYLAKTFNVSIPYLTIEQAEDLQKALNAGKPRA
jgi:hypothetical protein